MNPQFIQDLLNNNTAVAVTVVIKDMVTYLGNEKLRSKEMVSFADADLLFIEIWNNNKLTTLTQNNQSI